MKKLFIGTTLALAVLLLGATSSFAAANPNGSGQPSASCEDVAMAPQGFSSGGFANAETHYAGSDGTASVAHSKSDKAVSQYDVACYQVSQK